MNNLVWSTVLLLFLFSPGVIFINCALEGIARDLRYEGIVFSKSIIAYFIAALGVNVLSCFLFCIFYSKQLNIVFDQIFDISLRPSVVDLPLLKDNIFYAVGYYITSLGLAYFMGKLFQRSQLLYRIFMPKTIWYREFEKFMKKDDVVALVSVNIELSSGSFLYLGFFYDYQLNEHGTELDTLKLTNVHRRKIENDEDRKNMPLDNEFPFEQRYYQIRSDYVIFKFSEIKILSVKKVKVKLDPE